jgi:hypothetical protein
MQELYVHFIITIFFCSLSQRDASLWLLAFFQWCEDNGIVNPLPDPVRTDLYNIVFKFQKGQIDSKSVSETSVLVAYIRPLFKMN